MRIKCSCLLDCSLNKKKMNLMKWIFFICLEITICLAGTNFTIDYDKNSFSLDGKPFRYVSGSAHYFRMPHEYWRDRLRKMRAGGLNALSTYVQWSHHEPIPGQYDFSGDLNLTRYIEIAKEEGLFVILRPGPYICGERDMGGLPYWLISENPDFIPRTSDPKFTKYVEKWMDVLLPKIYPQLYGNGGPIILVQVENEYGVYERCDVKYKLWLRDLFKRHIKDKAVLFTTDSLSTKYLDCGKIPGIYATVDFGPEVDVDKAFSLQRRYEPKGPLVNSEYYVGWFTYWGDKMIRKDTKEITKTLKKILSLEANVNIYMYFGGTNFGFTSGAKPETNYKSYITSYDYDAPISEAGDLTEKYYAIRDAIQEFLPPSQNITVKTSEKGNYGEFTLRAVASLLSSFSREKLGVRKKFRYPPTFESANQNSGYLLYETTIKNNHATSKEYFLKSYDYANIYLDGKFITALSRERRENKFALKETRPNSKLSILLENLGRINVGEYVKEPKGILSNVTTQDDVLVDWNTTSFELKTVKPIEECLKLNNYECFNGQGFYIYATNFVLPHNATKGENNYLLDSFLDVKNLSKGLVFINDFNLGRYWSARGPQYALYVPGVYLKPHPQPNILIVIDENIREQSIRIKFSKIPIFSYK